MRPLRPLRPRILAASLLWTLPAIAQPAAPAPAPEPEAAERAERVDLAGLVSAERLVQTIEALPTARSGWGDEAHWQGLKEAERIVIERFEALGLAVQRQEVPWPARRRRIVSPDREEGMTPEAVLARPRFSNIWVDLPGHGKPGETLIFSAHLDAVAGSPGADDDGTGVAAILEMARLLKDEPRQRTIRLMLFTLEEAGLIGSRFYVAEGLERDAERIVGMVSLDMLGYFSDEPESQKSPIPAVEGVFEPPTVGNFIAMGGILKHRSFSQRLGRHMREGAPDLEVLVVDFLPIAPPDMLRSDHAPFLAIGAPAVILSDTANFRNPNYHTRTDTLQTVDVERFAHVVRGLVAAAAELAGGPEAAPEPDP
ncbi:MAG: M20/M25/M40 family metallo-hydrolase [Phycisphaerales bacterium JB039]